MGEELKVKNKKVGGLKVSSESDYNFLLISSKASHFLSSKTGDDFFAFPFANPAVFLCFKPCPELASGKCGGLVGG